MKRFTLTLAAMMILLATGCQKAENSAPIPVGGGPSPIAFQQEVATLNNILSKDPKNLNALIKLGNLYMDTEDFPMAIENYEKALAIDGKNQNVRVDMGVCYRRVGRSDKAMELFNEATKMEPTHSIAHMNAGIVLLYDFNKPAEALVSFEKFLEVSPNSPQANDIRALMQEIKNQTGK